MLYNWKQVRAEKDRGDTMAANPRWAPWALNRIIEPLMRNIRIRIPEFAGIKAGDMALDVCCGTGALALHYARMGITAAGIDLNPRVIEVAENKRRKLGLSNVSFQIADAQNLPFKDNFFDCASISFALHENEGTAIEKIIAEMKRVVKKGGTLIFMDFRVPLPKGLYFYFIHAIEFMAGKRNYRCFKNFIEQGGLDGILKKSHLPEGTKDDMNNKILEIVKTTNV